MRKLQFYLLLVLTISCNKDQVLPGRGNATFSMSQVSKDSGGRAAQSTAPRFVLLSLEDAAGKVVVHNKKLSLFSFGQGFVSEGLELPEGNYMLTSFQILSAGDTIIYASPLAGSDLAKYVTNPLPISFTISKDAVTPVVPQVLSVSSTDTPQNFGYANFGFEVVSVSGNKIKEIWRDEPYGVQYRTYYIYGDGNLPVREINYYIYSNIWSLLDSVRYQYNGNGSVAKQTRYELSGGTVYAVSTSSFSYYSNGLLSKISNSDPNNGSFWDYEFFYDQNGKPLYSHQKPPSSVNFFYQHEYSMNAQGDIDTISSYTINGLGKILKFKQTYTYDNSPSIFWLPSRDAPLAQKHNVKSLSMQTYSLIGSNGSYTLQLSYDCSYTIEYKYNAVGIPASSLVSNPLSCYGGEDDGCKLTYIYF